MKKHMKVLSVLAALCLGVVGVAWAAPMVDVGGVPIVWTTTGTGAVTAATTVTTRPGFIPDFVQIYDDLDSQSAHYVWVKGMAQDSSWATAQSSGNETLEAGTADGQCGITTSTAGQIVFDSNCFSSSQPYFIWAVRYAQ